MINKGVIFIITAEVALYPLKTSNASDIINKSISVLKNSNVEYTVGSMKTTLRGNEPDVFSGLQAIFSEAKKIGGEIDMVVTIGNAHG